MTYVPKRNKEDWNLTRLWKAGPCKKLLLDFYVVDVETAHRKVNKIFKDSSTFKGELKWQLKATPESFVFCVIYGYNYTKVCHSVEEAKKTFLEERFKDKIVYAHNGGTYDFPCIFGNPYEVDPEAIFNGKFISFTNGNCTFADSINIFIGMSVKTMGKMLKLEKLGMSKNYGKSIWPKDYARDVNGCTRDCVILWDALFLTFEFAGDIKITQASLSLSYYRRFHQPFHIDHNENVIHFWDSYYGGRTECFQMGKTRSFVRDVNSMYPFHLRNGKFPNPKTLKCELDVSTKRFLRYLEWFEGMAELEVVHKESDYGFLPTKKDGKLLFPDGNLKGSWNFPEIRFALKHKIIEIKKVHRVVYSEAMESPFKSFVDALHDAKLAAQKAGDKWTESMVKYYMNMLYGKFGQRITEECIYIRDINKEYDTIRNYQKAGLFRRLLPFNNTRNDAFLFIGRRKAKIDSYAIPSFASYVTSYGRVQILSELLKMKKNRPTYCDTDSIAYEIDTGLKSEHHLGGWKIEKKIITNIKGLKNYVYIDFEKTSDEQWRSKGVPALYSWTKKNGLWVKERRKTKIFEGDKEFVYNTVEQIGPETFRYFNLMKPREALRRNMEPGVLTERIKTLKNTYNKRIVFKDGKTKPITL